MLKRTEETAGTSLQGYTRVTTRAQITAVLGEPMTYEGGKVLLEWGVRLGGTVATVYDWKRYEQGTPADDEEMMFKSRLVSGGLVLDRPMPIFGGGVGVRCLNV
jgi:hypothetical protein